MPLATQTAKAQDTLSNEEVEALLGAVKSVQYSSDLLVAEWARKDLTVAGVAERIVDLARPLFRSEGEPDGSAPGFLFPTNPRVSFEAFVSALLVADLHATGRTELGWPLVPESGVPQGLRADSTIIHPVLSEEAARARYLEALENETSHPGFHGVLREHLEEAVTSSKTD